MTLLFNLLLPIVLLLIAYTTYQFYKKSDDRRITVLKGLVVAVLFVSVYNVVQPSYIPKTAVKALPKVPQTSVVVEVEDRLSKPLSKEESAKRVDSLLTAKDEIKEVLEKSGNK